MKQLLLATALLLSFLLPRDGRAEVSEGAAIEAVISEQFEAFAARDVARAWDHASPTIQGIFGTPENFGRMVRDGYPMVWTPAQREFLSLRDENGALWQRVLVGDRDGRFHVLEYKMVRVDGVWRIDGVMMIREAGIGA